MIGFETRSLAASITTKFSMKMFIILGENVDYAHPIRAK